MAGGRRLLVAADGTSGSAGALQVAHALQERDGCRVEVICVIEPTPVFDAGFMIALPEAEVQASRRSAVLDGLRSQLDGLGGGAPDWPVHTQVGLPASAIAERARVLGIDLIVMGLSASRPLRRWLGRETVLQVLHLSDTPILAVPDSTQKLPRTVLVAVDFSPQGDRAASALVPLVSEDNEVHLAHIFTGFDELSDEIEGWRDRFAEEARDRLRTLAREEGFSDDPLRLHLRTGEPAVELLQLLRDLEADLLVMGTHGHSFLGRLLLGSVSSRLVRSASTMVLVVPPEGASDTRPEHLVGRPEPEATVFHPWTQLLEEFTETHRGTRVSLDVDAKAWNARYSAEGLPLLGVLYDAGADGVEIAFGNGDATAAQVVHWIPEPERVLVLRDRYGRESALRVEGSQGTVIVTLGQQGGASWPETSSTVS